MFASASARTHGTHRPALHATQPLIDLPSHRALRLARWPRRFCRPRRAASDPATIRGARRGVRLRPRTAPALRRRCATAVAPSIAA
eukprot:6185525-Prymnesium_polylepis.1